MATGLAKFNYLIDAFLNEALRNTNLAAVTTVYCGLMVADTWQASTAYSLNKYIIPTNVANVRLFKCTTAGTSGAGEPNWNSVATAGTITDGTAVWTEQTKAIKGGTFPEVSGNAYARQAITFSAPAADADPAETRTCAISADVLFPQATPAGYGPDATVGRVFGFVLMDALTNGNGLYWGYLSAYKQVNANDQFRFPSGTGVKISES